MNVSEKMTAVARKLEALKTAFDMKGANATTIERAIVTVRTVPIHYAKYLYCCRILRNIRDKIGPLVIGLEDEGDRIYLGSTNDKEWLEGVEEIIMEIDDKVWAVINGEEKDPYVDLYKLNAETVPAFETRIAVLEKALGFYANPANWIDSPPWNNDPECITPKAIPVTDDGDGARPCDCGDTARKALSNDKT